MMSNSHGESGKEVVLKDPGALFSEDSPLASRKPGYSKRPEQIDFANAVEDCFESRSVLLADAPTGTGKSLAYLAPSILRAAQRGEKAIISTATLALQAQLLSEDLPPLRSAAAEFLGYPEEEGISYAVMKGRRNFLCTKRHLETLMSGSIFDAELVTNLDSWASETETGDREDLPFPMPVSAWAEVASDGEDCSPRICPYREGCHYYGHRDRAAEAEILVVNHALLLANVASFGAIFDTEGRHLVIDEAHRIEEIMAEAFGARVSYARILYVLRQARKRCDESHAATNTAEMAAELFFEDLRGGATRLHHSPPRAYGKLVDSLRELRSVLANAPNEEANLLQGMVGRLRKDLESFYTAPDDDYAYAVIAGRGRSNQKNYPELKSWLVETAEAFREGVLPLFEDGGVVLTSATLASASGDRRSFSYAKRRLGLADALDSGPTDPQAEDLDGQESRRQARTISEYAGAEVFDYEGRVLIYAENGTGSASRGMPAPTFGNADAFARECVRRTEELVSLSRGRALVILSTHRAVSIFRETFQPPHPVRYQGDDAPGRLVKWLRETEGAILVGTASFREGIDVAGEALSLVVMDKAPFAPPDDPVAAKLKEKAGDSAFREIFLPKAQVAMRQGAGRLMRRPTDSGVIAVLDPRFSTKGWGKAILSSLPPAPRTDAMRDVARFFRVESGGA
ncbi:ATP-dependent DNA helicase [soil metagenome]